MLTSRERKQLKTIVSEDNVRIVEIFETLGDANRCQLFRLAAKNPKLNVTEASVTLGLSVPLTSQHFKILEQNKLLIKTKVGREVFYSLNKKDAMVLAILKAIKNKS
jgi:DNA-binding transcriptional ArsR family regulator